jgi:hypothetical protein
MDRGDPQTVERNERMVGESAATVEGGRCASVTSKGFTNRDNSANRTEDERS